MPIGARGKSGNGGRSLPSPRAREYGPQFWRKRGARKRHPLSLAVHGPPGAPHKRQRVSFPLSAPTHQNSAPYSRTPSEHAAGRTTTPRAAENRQGGQEEGGGPEGRNGSRGRSCDRCCRGPPGKLRKGAQWPCRWLQESATVARPWLAGAYGNGQGCGPCPSSAVPPQDGRKRTVAPLRPRRTRADCFLVRPGSGILWRGSNRPARGV
jgi:hypothetical protein